MGYLAEQHCVVIVAGQDVTSRFDPHLISLKISRSAKDSADQADIELHDADGNIILPDKRSKILIKIKGQQVFDGFASDVDYAFSRSGRTLSISASSIDQGGKVKEPVMRHKDEASFTDVAAEWGKKAGLVVKVAGEELSKVKRGYWLSHNESFMGWGNRMAHELGASFKVIGDKAYFVETNSGLSATGKQLTPVDVKTGVNLISGNISPIISRPKFKDVKLRYFDIAKGEHVETSVETGIDDVDSALRTVISSADEDQAKTKGKAIGKESDREKGGGSLKILGCIHAEPEALCHLSGLRPGIDGTYRISSVSHEISRGGFLTDLSLKQPQDGAGKDTRGKKTAAAVDKSALEDRR